MAGKTRSVAALSLAAVLCMSLWFVSAAILPEIVAEGGLGPGRAALLSSAVQIGFVLARSGWPSTAPPTASTRAW